MGGRLELRDQTEFWRALTPWKAKITFAFKFWEAEIATLQRKTKDITSRKKRWQAVWWKMDFWEFPFPRWPGCAFCLRDVHDVAYCMLSTSQPPSFFFFHLSQCKRAFCWGYYHSQTSSLQLKCISALSKMISPRHGVWVLWEHQLSWGKLWRQPATRWFD